MSGPKRALIVMAKEPRAGATKTRLVPPFSAQEAATLYECMLLDTLDLARSLPDIVPFVAVSPLQARDYFHRIAPDIAQIPQHGESLGERLDHVLNALLAERFDQVAAVGSDVPTLPAEHVTTAFDLLDDETVDVVLGPSDDGGYHLIGWKHAHSALVRQVRMSTPRVLADTLDLAATEQLKVALLPSWYDVDVPADVDRLEAEVRDASELNRHTHRFFEGLGTDSQAARHP